MNLARRSPLQLVILAVLVLGGLAAVAGLSSVFLRDAPPPAVGLGSPSPGPSVKGATPEPGASGAAATVGPGGLEGTWTIDTSIGSFADFSSSFVGYRVNETFTDQSTNEAVGRTPNVSGSLTLDGTTLSAVEVTADLTALRSDDDRRDGQLERQALETARFPTATFKLTSPVQLSGAPVDGATLTAIATGELTLHGVTKTVDVPIEARLTGDVVTVTGSIDILFADYGIEQPTSFIVLSIEDHGTMELQLHFRKG